MVPSPERPAPEIAGAILTVDLDAIAENYRRFAAAAAPAKVAAVLKANAYGLGVAEVAPILVDAGAELFFVATIGEGIELRQILPDAEICVLDGLMAESESVFAAHNLVPVLNSRSEIDAWSRAASAGRSDGRDWRAIIHFDTGMSRLGVSGEEAEQLISDCQNGLQLPFTVLYAMSHLACADEPDHAKNAEQRKRFQAIIDRLPDFAASLANTAGTGLGPAYLYDMVRVGVGLYGSKPGTSSAVDVLPVVKLEGKILQVRDVDTPETVGYGAEHRLERPSRIATVGIGYADGLIRALGNRGYGYAGGIRVPLVGRVSMDLATFDVTNAPADAVKVGASIELIGDNIPIDEFAERAGTISHEILALLGHRYARRYLKRAGTR